MSTGALLSDPRDQVVAQRFEAKYYLSEVQVDLIRNYVAGYTAADPHRPVYPVSSIYLDNKSMVMFGSSLQGEKNRYKLRLRAYEGDETAPVFAEVKQRIGRIIRKHRSRLHRHAMNRPSWSEPLGMDALVDPSDASEMNNMMLFSELATRMGAEPVIGVRYMREAFVSIMDEPVRVTIDRDIAYAHVPDEPARIWSTDTIWRPAMNAPIVLEVKFTDAFPYWIRRMIQRFQLDRVSLAKYVVCVQDMRREINPYDVHEGAID